VHVRDDLPVIRMASRTALRSSPVCVARCQYSWAPSFSAAHVQRRWWWDHDAAKKHRDKPAIWASQYVFIRGQVPVVMLESVPKLGRKGQIVSVKRGYARHHLVPKGLALFGTWENIDAYADPAMVADPSLKAKAEGVRGRLPFDWINEICLQFIRVAREDNLKLLETPISLWDLLEELSEQHELDLLPSNIEVPAEGISEVGLHELPVQIPFRSVTSAAGIYSVQVDVVSQQSIDALRQEEMARAVKEKSSKFSIRQTGGVGGSDEGLDDDDDDHQDLLP